MIDKNTDMDMQNGYGNLVLSDALSDALVNVEIQDKCKHCEYNYNFRCRAKDCIYDDQKSPNCCITK